MIPPSISNYLAQRGVPFRAAHHPPGVTAQEIAAQAHISGKRFAKTVVLKRGGEPILAVLPASERIDLQRLGDLLGGRVTLAAEDEQDRLFPGCERGAMPPLGALYRLPVVVDADLATEESIAFNGGTHADVIEMSWNDFVALASPRVIEYAIPDVD